MTVIDASSVTAYALREEGWEAIESVLQRSPRSVELLPLEAANAILIARRRKRLSPSEAEEALRTIRSLTEVVIALSPHSDLVPDAWAIARDHGVTIYDAVYVALARRLRTSLVTRDSDQFRAAQAIGIPAIQP